MINSIIMKARSSALIMVLVFTMSLAFRASSVVALGSPTNPQSGSLGLEATVPGTAPTQAASIGIPSNGQVFTTSPITVSGLCKTGLLVKVFSNNIFVGSETCTNGSFSLKVDLFSGRNDLVARVYDAFDQQGPDSNVVTVTFNDAQFAQFGTHVTLTSSYARKGANPGDAMTWPFVLSGGTAPYALSVDWGDSSGVGLKSISFPGTVSLSHTYSQSGVYTVILKVTDANNTSAYLQVVGVANGKITGSISSTNGSGSQGTVVTKTVFLWQPLLAVVPLLLIAFWLGRRYELYSLRRTLEDSRGQG